VAVAVAVAAVAVVAAVAAVDVVAAVGVVASAKQIAMWKKMSSSPLLSSRRPRRAQSVMRLPDATTMQWRRPARYRHADKLDDLLLPGGFRGQFGGGL
jgi:hypothetical protein